MMMSKFSILTVLCLNCSIVRLHAAKFSDILCTGVKPNTFLYSNKAENRIQIHRANTFCN